MRATRRRALAIIQTMRSNDSITMIQAAECNGIPELIVVDWYQQGRNFSSPAVCKEFHRAIHRLLLDRESKEIMRQVLKTAISQAQAGDKKIQQLLNQKGIDFSQ